MEEGWVEGEGCFGRSFLTCAEQVKRLQLESDLSGSFASLLQPEVEVAAVLARLSCAHLGGVGL